MKYASAEDVAHIWRLLDGDDIEAVLTAARELQTQRHLAIPPALGARAIYALLAVTQPSSGCRLLKFHGRDNLAVRPAQQESFEIFSIKDFILVPFAENAGHVHSPWVFKDNSTCPRAVALALDALPVSDRYPITLALNKTLDAQYEYLKNNPVTKPEPIS